MDAQTNADELEQDLGLEGYGAVIVARDSVGRLTDWYLPFYQANELIGIVKRGTFRGMEVVEAARSTEPTTRRALDMMKGGRTHRTAILGYMRIEPDLPAPLDVIYRHRGRIWRRSRGGRVAGLGLDLDSVRRDPGFLPSPRRLTISLADSRELAFALSPGLVVVDRPEGVKRTIRHGLELGGIPARYRPGLESYLQRL